MNAEGGTLLIGVDDKGQVVGLEADYQTLGKRNRDGYELFLTQLLDTNLSGASLPLARISFSQVDGQDVCLGRRRRQRATGLRPAHRRQAAHRVWARVGNSTRQLVGTDMAQYQREHWD
jgi:hypothetical protein